jgi:hypothetical protein
MTKVVIKKSYICSRYKIKYPNPKYAKPIFSIQKVHYMAR